MLKNNNDIGHSCFGFNFNENAFKFLVLKKSAIIKILVISWEHEAQQMTNIHFLVKNIIKILMLSTYFYKMVLSQYSFISQLVIVLINGKKI